MKGRRRRISARPGEGGGGSQIMALSLFLMLLAFFIVLNAISSYEEYKVKPVMNNIKTTFAPRALRPATAPSRKRNPIEAMGEGSTIERLQALFRAQIPSADIHYNPSTGVMRTEMAYDKLEQAVMAIGQEKPDFDNLENASHDFFVPMLAALLDLKKADRPYRMSMIRTFSRDPASRYIKRKSMMQKRIESHGVLAKKLVEGGVSGKVLSVGLQAHDEADRAILFFRPYEKYRKGSVNSQSGQGPGKVLKTPERSQ